MFADDENLAISGADVVPIRGHGFNQQCDVVPSRITTSVARRRVTEDRQYVAVAPAVIRCAIEIEGRDRRCAKQQNRTGHVNGGRVHQNLINI